MKASNLLRLCLATQQFDELPLSDRLLREALQAEVAVWSDPNVDWSRYDAVVVRSCWDYHLRPDEFLRWINRVPVCLVNSAELIRWNLDKRYLREFSESIPETIWLDDHDTCDIAMVCRERGWQAAVVKPLISASAYGTEKLSTGMATGPAMVQRYLPQIRDRGEWSLLYFGGVYSHAILKNPAPGDFRVQKEFGGTYQHADPPGDLLHFATRVLQSLPQSPVIARVDLLEDGPVLMELELIEPEIFLQGPESVRRAADAILADVAWNIRNTG